MFLCLKCLKTYLRNSDTGGPWSRWWWPIPVSGVFRGVESVHGAVYGDKKEHQLRFIAVKVARAEYLFPKNGYNYSLPYDNEICERNYTARV